MKFRDGMWLVAENKRVEYAEDIFTIAEKNDARALSLLCPTRKIRSRGDQLNLSTIQVDIEAAFDGVISVEVTHFKGAQRRGPNFELYPDARPAHASNAGIKKSESGTTLTSGSLSATVGPDQHSFDIRFHDSNDVSKEVTSLLNRSVFLAYSPATSSPKQVEDMTKVKHYIVTQTELGVGESIHGLGERFGAFNKVGQSVEVWNEDGGTSSEQAYKNISFWLSSKGYGVFIDTPEKVDLEVGSERSCRLQTSVESQRLKWYVIYGPTPKEVLQKYTVLTGKSGKVPAWSFGLWLTTSFTTDYDEKTVTYFLEEMKARSIPLEVFHYDCFWLRAFHWCDFVWSEKEFPDPQGQIARLKEAKLLNKVCVWVNPYLGQASPVFDYAAEKGYLLKRANGDVWQWDLWQTGMGVVDITNPEACEWYVGCLNQLFDIGVGAIKTDFGERIPTKDVKWHDSTIDPERMHNFYAFAYNKLVYETMQKRFGKDEAVLFARTACAGTQRFPLCWGGDCESTAPALAESVRGGLSLGLCGFSSWSMDIGGFEGYPDPAVYKRWVQVGLLCTHSRLHGSNSYRVPWLTDKEHGEDPDGANSSTAVLRKFVRLKRSLMPYFLAQVREAECNGWPGSMRALALEFPDDPTSWFIDRQFMVGSQILVAPVFDMREKVDEVEVQFYLPPGKWTSWWTGETMVGGGWKKEKHGFGTLPMYVREGTVLVMGREDEKEPGEGFEYDWLSGGGEVKLFCCKTGDKATVVDYKGNEAGVLEVEEEEKLKGMNCLNGDWTVKVVSVA